MKKPHSIYSNLALGTAFAVSTFFTPSESMAYRIEQRELDKTGWKQEYFQSQKAQKKIPLHPTKSYEIDLDKGDTMGDIVGYIQNWAEAAYGTKLDSERVKAVLTDYNKFHKTKEGKVRIFCMSQDIMGSVQYDARRIDDTGNRLEKLEETYRGLRIPDIEERLGSLKDDLYKCISSIPLQEKEINSIKKRIDDLERSAQKPAVEHKEAKEPQAPQVQAYTSEKLCEKEKVRFYNAPKKWMEDFGKDPEKILDHIPGDAKLYVLKLKDNNDFDSPTLSDIAGIYADRNDGIYFKWDGRPKRSYEEISREKAKEILRQLRTNGKKLSNDIKVVATEAYNSVRKSPEEAGDAMAATGVLGIIFGTEWTERDFGLTKKAPIGRGLKSSPQGCGYEIYFTSPGELPDSGGGGGSGGGGASGGGGCGGSGGGGTGWNDYAPMRFAQDFVQDAYIFQLPEGEAWAEFLLPKNRQKIIDKYGLGDGYPERETVTWKNGKS